MAVYWTGVETFKLILSQEQGGGGGHKWKGKPEGKANTANERETPATDSDIEKQEFLWSSSYEKLHFPKREYSRTIMFILFLNVTVNLKGSRNFFKSLFSCRKTLSNGIELGQIDIWAL